MLKELSPLSRKLRSLKKAYNPICTFGRNNLHEIHTIVLASHLKEIKVAIDINEYPIHN